LLYAFPFLLLALNSNWYGTLAYIFGWSFAIWGIALYLFTGFTYLGVAVTTLKKSR
jgi:cardiolipin synthase